MKELLDKDTQRPSDTDIEAMIEAAKSENRAEKQNQLLKQALDRKRIRLDNRVRGTSTRNLKRRHFRSWLKANGQPTTAPTFWTVKEGREWTQKNFVAFIQDLQDLIARAKASNAAVSFEPEPTDA